ncbi:tRNA (N(6)-L-threonylcarbamoyladenosine(37)-C(2))-methylthiotransferase MtaB, partial [Patescibacteria group bacterium]|nr:tRNA (N(6)-L-threonylcarbamoyladenosine(37)-C(2))-methylthiotransferase MtaB [Patescibacteria group bacterium]
RKGTIAATMQNQIPYETKLKRSKELIKIGNQLRKKFIENHLDKELEVLFEQKNKDFYTGLTSNYIQVKVKSKKNLINQILTVQPEKTNNDLSVTASLKS